MDEQLLAEQLAKALAPLIAQRSGNGNGNGQKGYDQKIATGVPVGPYTHGPNGLFALYDGEHPLLSAMMQPKGLLSFLPILRADQHAHEYITTFTGVTAGAGTEPASACGQAVRGGQKKLCRIMVPWGRQMVRTREWCIPRLALRRDRHEDLSFTGLFPQQLMMSDNFFPPGGVSAQGNDILRSEIMDRLFELAVEFQRRVCPLLFTGTPYNNSGTGDCVGHMETPGLEWWVNTGNKQDIDQGSVCTILNSDIKDFGYNDVEGAAPDILAFVREMWRYVRYNAYGSQLDPVTWVFVMRPALFEILCDIWPCRYWTDRCRDTQAGADVVVLNDQINIQTRVDMREGSYLLVDGVRVPVIQDNCLPEEDWDDTGDLLAGEFASDIYLIPVTVLGGMRATYFQYFDQRLNVNEANIFGANTSHVWSTDSGLFLWGRTHAGTNFCEDMTALMDYRLMMHTPQLAGRILNVKYAPMQPKRDWDPEGKYFLDGGITTTPDEVMYPNWSV